MLIELTCCSNYKVYITVEHIIYFHTILYEKSKNRMVTKISLVGTEMIFVEETPEVIDKLIKGKK